MAGRTSIHVVIPVLPIGTSELELGTATTGVTVDGTAIGLGKRSMGDHEAGQTTPNKIKQVPIISLDQSLVPR